jgi:acetyl-CoA carboxylase biotin carboxyl carrier protein
MSDVVEYLERQLPVLLTLLQSSDVRELEVSDENMSIRVHRSEASVGTWKAQAALPLDVPESPRLGPFEIVSPIVGTFYRAGREGAPPLVGEGSHVEHDTIVGIVEALQVLTEVEAGCDGTVTRVLATDGQPVEYGQALFEVGPSD